MSSPEVRGRPWFIWAIALAVSLPMALVFWAWRIPAAARETTVFLAGEWQAREVLPGAANEGSAWRTVKLPGGFTAQGLKARSIVLRRSVDLPPGLEGADLLLLLGYVRDATVRVSVNGQVVGARGVYGTEFVGSESQLSAFFIPSTVARAGANEVTFEITSNEQSRDGLLDSRIVLGGQAQLARWAFRETSVRNFLELGAVLLLAFLAAVVLVLWRLQGARAPRTMYLSTLGLIGSSGLYLVGKTGLVLSDFLPSFRVVSLIAISVHALGLVQAEFVESYFLGRVTKLRWANRVVSGAFLVIALVIPARTDHPLNYQAYVLWLFGQLIYSVGLSLRDLVRPRTRFGPIVTVAVVLAMVAGVNDLLGDLDIVYTPRLFTLAIGNLAIAAAMVVIGEFLQLAEENKRLSSSLSTKNEELALALKRAEESSRVKSEFLANTSHELRTPLNAIINIPQGLLEQIDASRRVRCGACRALFELDEHEAFDAGTACEACGAKALSLEPGWKAAPDAAETARLLGSVVSSGTHLLAVVNDILDYSKIEAGRLTLHRQEVELRELLEGLRASLEPVAQRANVGLAIGVAERGTTLDVDRVKVMQVLINLVSNAIKFSDGRGQVSVTFATTADRVAVSVRDEGIGIAPEHQAAIFEGFRQVETGNTRRFGGTGLGLAISKRLVEAHGGALTLQSAVGAGSTFTVDLPRRAVGVASPTPRGRIALLIDDEVSALDAASVALKPLDLTVVTVRDPRDALPKLRELKPAFVLLDVMMPRVSGLELLQQLRADPALKDTPVIVSSAYPDNQSAAEVLGATFIAKPWAPGELLKLVEGVLSQPAARGQS